MNINELYDIARNGDRDVKSGLGGIRDVEFVVQALQMIHLHEHQELLTGNTLDALSGLRAAGLIDAETASQLAGDYSYLRRVEHCLQILEDRQIHALPTAPEQLAALARRVDGPDASGDAFLTHLRETQSRTREAYERQMQPTTEL